MIPLTIGKIYRISYMPTRYLYERISRLVFQSDTHLKFDELDSAGDYFQTMPKFVKEIEEVVINIVNT